MAKLLIVVAYVLCMLIVGYVCMRKTKTVSDFFLGNRSIGPWMSAFAYGTTYFSAVLFIGYAGALGWRFGIHTMWIVAGNVLVGSLLAWMILAKRTRTMTAKLGALTMPAFLQERYNSTFLKFISAVIIFVFLVPYSASVYTGLSYLFEVNFGISFAWALAFLAGLTALYLMMGGYFALTITDFIRGLVEIAGVGIMVCFLVNRAHPDGGLAQGFATSVRDLLRPENSPGLLPSASAAVPGWFVLACLVLLTSFGPWGLPQMVQKFYSIKSELDIKRAMIVATCFCLFIAFAAYFTGSLTHLFYEAKDLPLKLDPMGKPVMGASGQPTPDFDKLIPDFLTRFTPPWVSMVILLLVFSASMCSLSSLVLVSSSAIAMDLYQGILRPNAPKGRTLALMRILCLVFVAASVVTALEKPDIIMNLMAISWGVLGGCFAAPYIYGLFWKRTTTAGATAGLLSGLITSVGLFLILGPSLKKDAVPVAGAVAMIVPFIIVPVVSLLTPKPSPKMVNRAFEA